MLKIKEDKMQELGKLGFKSVNAHKSMVELEK